MNSLSHQIRDASSAELIVGNLLWPCSQLSLSQPNDRVLLSVSAPPLAASLFILLLSMQPIKPS